MDRVAEVVDGIRVLRAARALLDEAIEAAEARLADGERGPSVPLSCHNEMTRTVNEGNILLGSQLVAVHGNDR